ncbi:hypothetical protein [Rhodopirellula europaea]|uniref:hypothetical protein n=1 Tax=Rhodopirellula europaea TaxID=1263866 RepID=UPI003D2BF89B
MERSIETYQSEGTRLAAEDQQPKHGSSLTIADYPVWRNRPGSVDGGKAGFGKILGRSLARMIPFDPLSYLFGDKRLGWHDTLSGTRVIDISKS